MNLSEKQIRLLHSGNCLACRMPAEPGRQCWVMVTPFKINPVSGMSTLNAPGEPWQYRVRHFSIPEGFDYDRFDLHPEYVTDCTNRVVSSVEVVAEVLFFNSSPTGRTRRVAALRLSLVSDQGGRCGE